jgi:hypothetical protein
MDASVVDEGRTAPAKNENICGEGLELEARRVEASKRFERPGRVA